MQSPRCRDSQGRGRSSVSAECGSPIRAPRRSADGPGYYYTPDVIAALHEVWEITSESCGENLHPMILGSVKAYLRRFTRDRRCFGGKGTTRASGVITMVPIRMDGWDTAETGVIQVDAVAHCGDSVAGDFVYTVNGHRHALELAAGAVEQGDRRRRRGALRQCGLIPRSPGPRCIPTLEGSSSTVTVSRMQRRRIFA